MCDKAVLLRNLKKRTDRGVTFLEPICRGDGQSGYRGRERAGGWGRYGAGGRADMEWGRVGIGGHGMYGVREGQYRYRPLPTPVNRHTPVKTLHSAYAVGNKVGTKIPYYV